MIIRLRRSIGHHDLQENTDNEEIATAYKEDLFGRRAIDTNDTQPNPLDENHTCPYNNDTPDNPSYPKDKSDIS